MERTHHLMTLTSREGDSLISREAPPNRPIERHSKITSASTNKAEAINATPAHVGCRTFAHLDFNALNALSFDVGASHFIKGVYPNFCASQVLTGWATVERVLGFVAEALNDLLNIWCVMFSEVSELKLKVII